MVDPGSVTGGGGRAPTSTGSMWDPIAARLGEALLGDFELLGKLGEGGMAAVFLAHEFALNRKVALKVMSPALMMGEGMVDRFRQEAVTQANLQHANIVGVHGVRNVDDLHFFVMQYVMGRTLQDALRSELAAGRFLHVAVVQALIYQVGSALAYAHRRGVIHRDVKPGNILLNGDGDAVVTDFGIAKVAEAPSQTMTGTVVGTPAYMSPEQCFASQLTPASDQYSLGVVAYELITGRTPFQGTAFVLMQAHTTKPPPPFAEVRTDCPPEVEAAVMRMLAKGPEERFANIGDALHAMGAQAPGVRADDPLRRELQRLADVQGVEASLGDILSAPLSPIPRTKGTGRAGAASTGASTGAPPAGEAPTGEALASGPSSTASTSGATPSATPPPAAPSAPVSPAQAPRAHVPASATEVLAGRSVDPPGATSAAPGHDRSVAAAPSRDRDPTPSDRAGADAASRWRAPMLALTAVLSVVAVSLGVWAIMRPAPDARQEVVAAPAAPPIAPDSQPAGSPASDDTPTTSESVAAPDGRASLAIIDPPSRQLEMGQRLTLGATADRATGAPPLTWRSAAPRIAAVNARTGVVEGRSAGVATVIASQGTQRDSVQLTVVPAAGRNVADQGASATPPAGATKSGTPTTAPAPVSAALPPPETATPPPRSVEPPSAGSAGAAAAVSAAPTKSEAELVAEAERTIGAYASAIGSRDTSRVRRAFPGASAQLLRQWQSMYEATEQVRVTVDAVQPLDNVVVPPGASSRFRVKQSVSFTVAGSRRAQVQQAEYTATLRRDATGWTLVGISDR